MAKFKIGDVIVNREPEGRKYDRTVIGNSSDGQVVYEYRHPSDSKLLVGFFSEDGFVLKPTKKEGWIVISNRENGIGGRSSTMVYPTKEIALSYLSEGVAVKVEWEE